MEPNLNTGNREKRKRVFQSVSLSTQTKAHKAKVGSPTVTVVILSEASVGHEGGAPGRVLQVITGPVGRAITGEPVAVRRLLPKGAAVFPRLDQFSLVSQGQDRALVGYVQPAGAFGVGGSVVDEERVAIMALIMVGEV